jgi:hypothetical protein
MIPVRAGREFNGDDVMNAPGVIVVNAAAARRFWPGENAVGQRIDLPGPDNTSRPLTVVGVTGDVRQRGLGIAPLPEIFLNYQQPAPGVVVARAGGADDAGSDHDGGRDQECGAVGRSRRADLADSDAG